MKKLKVAGYTIDSAFELVVEAAESYRERTALNSETDVMIMSDEMSCFTRLLVKIEKAKSSLEICDLLVDSLVPESFTKKEIMNRLIV